MNVWDEVHQKALDTLERNNGDKTKTAKELGIGRKTLYRWLDKDKEEVLDNAKEVINPPDEALVTTDGKVTKTSLTRIKRQLELVVDGIIIAIPEKARKATLADSVNALVKLVPVWKDINTMLLPPRHADKAMETLKERAQRKLARMKKNGNGSEDPGD